MTTTLEPQLTTWERGKAPLAVMVTVVLWASAFVGIRALADVFSPGALSLGRLLIGTIALGMVAAAWGQATPLPQPKQWRSLVVIGALWFALYNLALNYAEHIIDAGTASMLLQLSPLLIAVMAAIFLGERFTVYLGVGLIVAFLGVALIAWPSSAAGPPQVTGTPISSTTVGVLLCLVCCVAYSVSVIFQKPLVAEIPAIQITWLACGVGMLMCLPFAGQLWTEVRQADPVDLTWLLYLGVFPTAIAFTTYAYALSQMSASALGVTTYLVPPVAIGLGWLLLGEMPTLLAYLGGALTVLGVAVARYRPER